MDSAKASQLIEVPDTVWNRPFYKGVRAFFSLFCKTYLRLDVDGLENLPSSGGIIVAVNHQSHLDVPLMGLAVPRESRFPGKAELFTTSFFLRTFLLNLGGFPIVRGEGDRKAISLSESILQRGDVLVLFPEGTRTRNGEIGSFHRGLGVLSIRTGAPIVPAAMTGSGDSLGVGKIWPRPGRIAIRFSKPLTPPSSDLSPKEMKDASQSLTTSTENEVRALYRSLRSRDTPFA
ncbi:MAG: 1-acyl-sn-glycerol-3-phosphate acyltransferase [Nitrospirae bacterium]|jgi:1-acyl-sn-glycerol-3-phosphate acyltransferase|nr:1-acyl-sn-glycerol-3-phosphate acyltransferase [Nitrospirota bacterium]